MDIAAILHEIDAEIEKLERIRDIVVTLARPVRRKYAAPEQQERPVQERPVQEPVLSEPTLVILPPKQKREYRRGVKPLPKSPRALASKVPDKPVFVPRMAVEDPKFTSKLTEFNPEALEAALRQNLLGNMA